jgi:uncharacterized protein (TIGR02679 family)
MPLDLDRLARLLGGHDLADLRRRLRARFERGADQDEFTLRLSVAERRALSGLLGRPVLSAGSMRLRLADVDEALVRAGIADSLRSALEALDGAIHDRKAARTAHDKAWAAMLERVTHTRLQALVIDPVGGSLLKRFARRDVERAAKLLEAAAKVIHRLPAQGTPLSQLAATELGNAHALDAGRPVASLVLRAFGLDLSLEGGARPREQWARIGVTVNELAAPALCLNLQASDSAPAAKLARAAAESGEPFHLTLRMLLRAPPEWAVSDRRIFVCENPSILAIAAERLGARCAPLICTNGMPAAAQQALLRQVAARGARLEYHGDFDWPGIQIGNFMMRELNASPWRFATPDYESACSGSNKALSRDAPIDASWDQNLSVTMSANQESVHEEAVAETLIEDLITGS